MDHTESIENYQSPKKEELKEDASQRKKFIMWENGCNICWLDASLALVAHNRVMKKYCQVSPGCKISTIISQYDEAISLLNNPEKNFNHSLNLAKQQLKCIQQSTLTYLKPILKFEIGNPESAFCCLYNLLIEDSAIKSIFDVTWLSVKECTNCGDCTVRKKKKPIITLAEVDSFDPENPTVLCTCPCNKSVQKLKLVYAGLPPCLIFHFESGAGKESPPLSFTTQGREYQLTGIMTLEKNHDSNVNHFITWVRDPSVNKWLDCNDLYIDIISYSSDFPDIKFQDVFIYVYESFDDMGTVINCQIVDYKNTKSNEAICFVDLSEESESENSNSQSFNKDAENKAIVESGGDKSESSNSQNVSEMNKVARLEISACNAQLKENFIEVDKDKSYNNCSSSSLNKTNKDIRKMEVHTPDLQLQGNMELQVLKTGLEESSLINPKLTCQEEKNPEEHQLPPEQCHLNLGAASEAEDSTLNSERKGIKILKDFEDHTSCHDPDCGCELASLEEEIDIIVDFTLAYMSQLSKMSKKPSSK